MEASRALGVAIELGAVELRQVPELVAGHVRGAEREPCEVERALAEQQGRRVSDPRGRGEQSPSETEHLADAVTAEHLVDRERRAEQPLESPMRRPGLGPLAQHDPVVQLPPAHERSRRGLGRRTALVGIDRECAATLATEALPHGCGRVERVHVVHPLIGCRPLERVEEAVITELDAAVQGVLGAGGELCGGRVELVPDAAFPQRGQRGEASVRQHPAKKGRAGGVELQNREHGYLAFSGAVSLTLRRSWALSRAASRTRMTFTPSAAVPSSVAASSVTAEANASS